MSKFKFSVAAALAVTLALGATAAMAEKTYIGHDGKKGLSVEQNMAVWGNQINNRGWDTDKNFPIKHPQRGLSVYRVPAYAAFAGMNFGQRVAIQKRLAAYGLYHDRIDGKWGPNTWAAVRGYAAQAGVYDELRTRKGSYHVFRGIAR